jgi:hypothetical protein
LAQSASRKPLVHRSAKKGVFSEVHIQHVA